MDHEHTHTKGLDLSKWSQTDIMLPRRRTGRVNSRKAAAQRVKEENCGSDDYEEDDKMEAQVKLLAVI